MKFMYYDLGQCTSGEIVEIILSGSAANVRLMDSSNLNSYKNGRNHKYIGGLAKKSPVRLQIPSSGHWHVAVDMTGLRGNVKSSARLLPSPLPTIQQSPLSSVPSLVQPEFLPDVAEYTREYDVFISHASEDKEGIVTPLAKALKNEGLRVWYDEFELKIGDSLRRKIDRGLANSRVGLVVLSQSFISKGWTNYELDGIVTRTITGEQILLPIWHKISKQEVIEFSPSLADKVARSTATHTVEEIASEIAELIRSVSDAT
ncbi:molecular chaperone Tir [Westiellopsis prolifica IICB1]|nr:molecular chaperone Tir [Westiellopsis prolifica IICB1]